MLKWMVEWTDKKMSGWVERQKEYHTNHTSYTIY